MKPKALSLHRFSQGKNSRIASSSTKLNRYFFLDRFGSNETCANLVMLRHSPGTLRSRGTVIHSLLKKGHLPLQSSFIYTNTSDNYPTEKKGFIHFPGGCRSKKKHEDLQAELNVLEDSRDTWKESRQALEGQTHVRAVRTLHDQIVSHRMHPHLFIKVLPSSNLHHLPLVHFNTLHTDCHTDCVISFFDVAFARSRHTLVRKRREIIPE